MCLKIIARVLTPSSSWSRGRSGSTATLVCSRVLEQVFSCSSRQFFFLERRRRTALHYIKKRKGKIPENTKQHKDTTQHQTHTGTHILALTHPPTGILKQSRLLTRIERKNDHQRPSFHSTNVEAVRKEIPRAPAIDHNFLSSLDRIRARATSGAAPSKTQLFR